MMGDLNGSLRRVDLVLGIVVVLVCIGVAWGTLNSTQAMNCQRIEKGERERVMLQDGLHRLDKGQAVILEAIKRLESAATVKGVAP